MFQKMITGVIVVVVVIIGIFFLVKYSNDTTSSNINTKNFMNLSSSVFTNGETIPEKYTCDGEDISPVININGVPKNTKDIVLIFDDPDSPSGTWTHWTIWNIPPETNQIKENSVPDGVTEGMTSFGNIGYGGPCPGSGVHRYFFKIYAMDKVVNLDRGASIEELEKEIEEGVIDKAEIMATYGRKK